MQVLKKHVVIMNLLMFRCKFGSSPRKIFLRQALLFRRIAEKHSLACEVCSAPTDTFPTKIK